MLLHDVKNIKNGRIISGQRELTLDSKTKDDREPDQSDIEAAQRGNNMVGMSVADLNDLVRLMEGKPTFAAKVTVIAAKQMIAAKKRMGAGDFKSTKDQIAELESQKEEAKKMGYGTDAYDAKIKSLQKDDETLYNVFAKRDGVKQKFNAKPLTAQEADELVNQIEKGTIPSVEKGSANRVIIDSIDEGDIFTQDPKTKDVESYYSIYTGEDEWGVKEVSEGDKTIGYDVYKNGQKVGKRFQKYSEARDYIDGERRYGSKDSDIIINVVESPNEVEPEEEAFDLVHYNGYNIKLVKETGEYDIYDVGGAMIGHTATLELAKLFVDNKGNATIVYE